MLTVSNGNTQNWGAEYDAFGNQLSVTLTPGFLPGPGLMEAFGGGQGYQTDSDTGLVRCGNRYYWPLFGRWLTQDPAGAGDNWYGYCGNEPTGGVDPDGLDWELSTDSYGNLWWDYYDPNNPNPSTTTIYPNGIQQTTASPPDYSTVDSQASAQENEQTSAIFSQISSFMGDCVSQLGHFVDKNVTFGLASAAGTAWGNVDSGTDTRTHAISLTAALCVAVVAGAITDGGEAAAADVGKVLVTHWDTPAAIDALKTTINSGIAIDHRLWVMKGKANPISWIMTGKFFDYKYANRITWSVEAGSLTRGDLVQTILGHYIYNP